MTRILFALAAATAAGCLGGKKDRPAPPPPPVTVIRPAAYPVQNYYEYNGTLDAVESVLIQARVEGFLNEVRFKEGDEVKANDPLYLIDPREYASAVAKARSDIAKAKADIENAKAQIQLAEADVGRITAVGVGASKSEIDKATALLAAAKAMRDVAVANQAAAEAAEKTAILKLSYTDIRAPIAGRISRTLVTPGNLVGQKEATLLTSIVSVDPMYVYFDVPERDFTAYQRLLNARGVDRSVPIPVGVGVGREEGFPHPGRLDFQENRVETGSGTVRIRGVIPNPLVPPRNVRLLYPGLYCRVRVPAGEPQSKLTIPEDSLMTGQEGSFVYVLNAENVIQKQTVVLGPNVWRSGNGEPWTLTATKAAEGKPPETTPVRSVVAIESGLQPDDRIVAIGLLKARPGQPVAPDDWDFRPPPPKERP